jgi:hypothetical protein
MLGCRNWYQLAGRRRVSQEEYVSGSLTMVEMHVTEEVEAIRHAKKQAGGCPMRTSSRNEQS